jgi:hypothetical protein
MVGDSIQSDIIGAIKSKMIPVLYRPLATEKIVFVEDTEVPIVGKMRDLLSVLGIQESVFNPEIIKQEGEREITINDLGIDIVTTPRHCMNITKDEVISIIKHVEFIIHSVSEKNTRKALYNIVKIITIVSRSANLIDESKLVIKIPEYESKYSPVSGQYHFIIKERNNSILVFFEDFSIIKPEKDFLSINEIENIILLIKEFFDNLSIDHPRAALEKIKSVALLITKKFGDIKPHDVVIEIPKKS